MKKSTLITTILVLGAIIFITIMISVKAQESPDDSASTPSEQPTKPTPYDSGDQDPKDQEYHNLMKSTK